MSYKIAVATQGGHTVDTHFGHALDFTIIEVADDGSFSEVERRDAFAACDGGCARVCNANSLIGASQSEDSMERAAANLADCEFVLAAKIGSHAINALAHHGITPLDCVIAIDEAVAKIHAYRERTRAHAKADGAGAE